mmetsp:Transcript_20762/g.17732  ORF Transcript_20762/g.17732 Transcript_20762/m.17732 type:complete len:120 (-) Transcript_20762:5-364(-)
MLVLTWLIKGVPGTITLSYRQQSVSYIIIMIIMIIIGILGYYRRKRSSGCVLIRAYASMKGILYILRIILIPLSLGFNDYNGNWRICCSGLELSSSAIFSVIWILIDMYMLWIANNKPF